MSSPVLTTPETVALIASLCNQLRWAYGYGRTRADHIQLALRLVELSKTLPDNGDGA